jgi:hypothetical protein
MHEYDVAFKLILAAVGRCGDSGDRRDHHCEMLSVELAEVRNTCVDLLGETEGGDLIHIELQSTNDPTMPLRMIVRF